ncbi:MAG: SLC45 family MFS transporter [archaeon]|nr:SLC45 family MFS transporter [archaeon]
MTENTKVDQKEPWEKDPKFNIKTIALISFGFFATSAAWSMYNSQIPLLLDTIPILTGQYFLIGAIMTIDNLIGSILQPFTGNLSDRTKSKFGRRMPFILIGLPISAVLLSLIPLVASNLILIILIVFLFCSVMAIWRAPVVALMPDFVAPEGRSKGNAIVNMFGGIAAAVVSLVGGQIIKTAGVPVGFLFVSICMLVALIVLYFGVKEPNTKEWDFSVVTTKEKKEGIVEQFKEILSEEEKSPLFMLGAIFFWFMTYQALESLLSLYATRILGIGSGTALQLLFIVSISFILFAIPSSILAKKYSRRLTILIGLIICVISLFSIGFLVNSSDDLILLLIFLAGFGCGWAFINVNSIAMMWEMAPTQKHIGTYTGLYYFASFWAAVIGPMTVGYIMQYIAGLEYLFIIGSIFMVLAILCMLKVKRGEVAKTE